MTRTCRLRILFALLVVFLSGAASFSWAQETPQSTPPSLTLSSPAEIDKFLDKYQDQLTAEQKDLLQKALLARQANDGLGNLLFLSPSKQLEVVTSIASGFFSSLWPSYDENNQATRPGVLGTMAGWTDSLLRSPQPFSAQQLLASLTPAGRRALAQGGTPTKAFSQLPEGTTILSSLADESGHLDNIVTKYWSACRNIAYALLTLVLVIFGFLIMLRQNVEPRVTMTISNALPRIATALVLITFSFAISGLIIDVGRIADGAIKSTFGDTQKENHTIYSLLASFGQMGLTNMKAGLRTTQYVWTFPEDTLDRNFPQWRCDYHPECQENIDPKFGQGNGTACQYREGYQDQDQTGHWVACPPFACTLLPFGMGHKYHDCRITLISVNLLGVGGALPRCDSLPPRVSPFPGVNCDDDPDARPEIGGGFHIKIDLMDWTNVPPGVGGNDNDNACNKVTIRKVQEKNLPHDPERGRDTNCCNYQEPGKCHGNEVPWAAAFPRSAGNIIEMWINRLILLLVGAVINFLFFMTLLQAIISLLFKLVSCFAMWFLSTIFSPLVFMWGTIPGQEETIINWLKSFLANVLAFPVVNFLINLAYNLAMPYAKGTAPGFANFPTLLYTGAVNGAAFFVPFGIILLTPQVPDLLKEILGAKGGRGGGGPDMSKQVRKLPIIGGLAG